jgi:hypothetical protein
MDCLYMVFLSRTEQELHGSALDPNQEDVKVCYQPIVPLGACRIFVILTLGDSIWKGPDLLLSSNTESAPPHWIMICDYKSGWPYGRARLRLAQVTYQRREQRRAYYWLGRIARYNQNLFAHWQCGARPAAGR